MRFTPKRLRKFASLLTATTLLASGLPGYANIYDKDMDRSDDEAQSQKRADDLESNPTADKLEFSADCQKFFQTHLALLNGNLEKARKSNDALATCDALTDLAAFYNSSYGMFDKADDALKESVEIASKIPTKIDSCPASILAKAKLLAAGNKTALSRLEKTIQSQDLYGMERALADLSNVNANDGQYDSEFWDGLAELRKEAKPYIEQSLAKLRAYPDALAERASLYAGEKKHKIAKPLYEMALRIATERFGPSSRGTCEYTDNLSNQLISLCTAKWSPSDDAAQMTFMDKASAEASFLVNLKQRQASFGACRETASAMTILGRYYLEIGDNKKSERYFAEAVDTIFRGEGCCVEEEAQALHELASPLYRQEFYGQAEECDRKGLSIRARLYKNYNRKVDGSYSYLTQTLAKRSGWDRRRFLRRHINLRAAAFGIGSRDVVSALKSLDDEGELRTEDVPFLDEALAAQKSVYGEGDFKLVDIMLLQAKTLSGSDRARRNSIYSDIYTICQKANKLETDTATKALVMSISASPLEDRWGEPVDLATCKEFGDAKNALNEYLDKIRKEKSEVSLEAIHNLIYSLSISELTDKVKKELLTLTTDDLNRFVEESGKRAEWIGSKEVASIIRSLSRAKRIDSLVSFVQSKKGELLPADLPSTVTWLSRAARECYQELLEEASANHPDDPEPKLDAAKLSSVRSCLGLAGSMWQNCTPSERAKYQKNLENDLDRLGSDIASEFESMFRDSVATAEPPKTAKTLYVLSIGIGESNWSKGGERVKHQFYVDDSKSICATIKEKCQSSFDRVELVSLSDEEASITGIWKAFSDLQERAQPHDTFVFVYSGPSRGYCNGVALTPYIGKYSNRSSWPLDRCTMDQFAVTVASRDFGLIALESEGTTSGGTETPISDFGFTPLLVSANLISERSKGIKADKKLFILNAWHSNGVARDIEKNIESDYSEHPVQCLTLGVDGDFGVMDESSTAASSEQRSEEGTHTKRTSAFSYALRQALQGKADSTGSGNITAFELWSYMNGEGNLLAQSKSNTIIHASRPRQNFSICKVGSSDPQTRTARALPRPTSLPDEVLNRLKSRNLAVFIGTNEYEDKENWHPLANPEPDSEQLAELFREYYGWEVKVVPHPSNQEFRDLLDEITNLDYGDGQLFVYVAGHGCFLPKKRIGYIVNRDSDLNDVRTMVSHSDLQAQLSRGNCHNVVLALDVCYAGTLLDEVAKFMSLQTRDPAPAAKNDILADASLEVICKQSAGRATYKLLAPAIGPAYEGHAGTHSPFAERLLKVLKDGGGVKKFITFPSLAEAAQSTKGENSSGISGDFAPSNSMGAFIIARKETLGAVSAPSSTPAPAVTMPSLLEDTEGSVE